MSTTHRFFRMEGNIKVEWKFVIDNMVIIDEIRVGPEQGPVTNVPDSAQSHVSEMRARGVEMHMENGRTVITSMPQIEQDVYKFFTATPCWFEGCEDLKKSYNEQLTDLGDDCRNCDKGALMRKMIPHIRKALHENAKI